MRIEIRTIDDNGTVQYYNVNGSLEQLVWDGFLTAERQDEQWKDKDTCDLIVKKLKGESPIEYSV